MSSSRRLILIVLAVLVALFAGGAYAYWHFLIRGPFLGATHHDFGDVPLYDDTARVEHTFQLANRLDRPLTIVAVRPECGCLSAPDLKTTLQPGEAFDLPVTMIVNHEDRSVLVRIVFDDGSTAALRLEATGRYQPRLASNSPAISLRDEGAVEVVFSLSTFDTYDDPVQPTIESALASLDAEFVDWKMMIRPSPQFIAIAPTIWEGRVRVTFNGDPATLGGIDAGGLPANAAITIGYPKARPLTIGIRPVGAVIPPESAIITVPSDTGESTATQPGR